MHAHHKIPTIGAAAILCTTLIATSEVTAQDKPLWQWSN